MACTSRVLPAPNVPYKATTVPAGSTWASGPQPGSVGFVVGDKSEMVHIVGCDKTPIQQFGYSSRTP